MATAPAEKIDSAAIRLAMSARWADPEYAILWEVGDATGGRHTRFADAVIMSLWPSRGLELHGVEIKVSKSDWKREAAIPKKAEAVGAYCDRWWVHTAPGVIGDLFEVPPAWGWREWGGKSWKTHREAAKTDAKPCDRQFLAALLRRADIHHRADIDARARRLVEKDKEAFEARLKAEVDSRTRVAKEVTDQLQKLEEAMGIKLSDWNFTDAALVGTLVKIITESGVAGTYNKLEHLVNQLGQSALRLDEGLRAAGMSGLSDGLEILRERFRKKRKMTRLPRPHIPLEVRCRVALRQLGVNKFWRDQDIEYERRLKDGDVVDVEVILGERKEPKVSERLTVPV